MSGNEQQSPSSTFHLSNRLKEAMLVTTETGAKPRLFSTDHHSLTLPDGHKFPAAKYGMVRQLIEGEGLYRLEPASLASPEVVELAHDPAYVRRFLEGSLPAAALRRIGLPWSAILVKRALASVQGTLSASLDALKHGWGGTMGGGTHHAFRAEGAGFCVFNDLAVSIESLRASGLIRRAAVIDLDVHQGDGTAEIFQGDSEVFTLSIHCASNFPFRKQRSTLDVALPDRVGDEDYLGQLNQVLPEVFSFSPDIIFYQSGVDGLASDSLGHLALTRNGLVRRDEMVMTAVRARGVPIVLTSGGGYSRPIELSAQAHAATYRTAWRIFLAPPGAMA
jgi:acetoin utilization deacetylase AcuC-like enzyme